jgi:hypothetical protein
MAAAPKEARGRKPAPRRAAPVVVPEAVEQGKEGGIDLDSGLVLGTTLVLFLAIVFLWIELAKHYDAGPFG